MKSLLQKLSLPFFLLMTNFSFAQNVGIGTTNPQQKLEVNGAVKIGANNSVAPAKGTIRWNENRNDFEGFNGFQWMSLTGGKNGIGDTTNYATPSLVYDPGFVMPTGVEPPAFGVNLAKSGNMLISGAPGYTGIYSVDGHDKKWAGKVRLFSISSDGMYYSQGALNSPVPGESFSFGASLAADDQRIIVGEPDAKVGSIDRQGKVHIYSAPYTFEATLIANDPVENDNFGSAVAIRNNFAVVGVRGKTVSDIKKGKVYIYKKNTSSGEWALAQSFIGASFLDAYGAAVAVTDQWMAVSSPLEARNSHIDHGVVRMYKLNTANNTWAYNSPVVPADNGYHGGFGSQIVLKGDTMLVTETRALYREKCRVYLFILQNGTWQQQTEFVVPGTNSDSDFGGAIDFSGNKVLIGEPLANVGEAFNNGKAHLFEWAGGQWNYRSTLGPNIKRSNLFFGKSVLIDQNEILCGASGALNVSGKESGLMYIFSTP